MLESMTIMNRINLKGPHSSIIEPIVIWFEQKYLPNLHANVDLKIQGVKWSNSDFASAHWNNSTLTCTIKYNLNRVNDCATLTATILHELWHFKQYCDYDLIHCIEDQWIWKGRKINVVDYYAQPWEKEARRMEKQLFIEYTTPIQVTCSIKTP